MLCDKPKVRFGKQQENTFKIFLSLKTLNDIIHILIYKKITETIRFKVFIKTNLFYIY